MIYPTPSTWPLIVNTLLKQRPISGLGIHDLHLAATMLSNGVQRIYTFNARDFRGLEGIEVIIPPEPNPDQDAESAADPSEN